MTIKEKVVETISNVGGCDGTTEYDKGWDEAISAVYDAVNKMELLDLCENVNTELLLEENECLKRNLQLNVCCGCWLKEETAIANKIGNLNERIEAAILELRNLKKCYVGSEEAYMKSLSFEDYIQEIIDLLTSDLEG